MSMLKGVSSAGAIAAQEGCFSLNWYASNSSLIMTLILSSGLSISLTVIFHRLILNSYNKLVVVHRTVISVIIRRFRNLTVFQ